MTSKRYLALVLALVVSVAGSFTLFNLVQDDFGLFWSRQDKRIWTLEKTTKYLLSYRYIPEHFDGLLIGPSYSDGFVNTKQLDGYRIYNLSMEGGNATELRAAAVNAMERGHMRFIVICLSSYLTKDHGMKGPQINAKEYWGSLFSWLPIEILRAKWEARRHPEADRYVGTEWGASQPLSHHIAIPWDDYIQMQLNDPLLPQVDPVAYEDLRAIVATAHARGVKVLAYFYPYDHWRIRQALANGMWQRYQADMRALFDPRTDVVVDMTTPDYMAMRFDVACYTDEHLSAAGAQRMLAELQRLLDAHIRGIPRVPTLKTVARVCAPSREASGFDRAPDALATELRSLTAARAGG